MNKISKMIVIFAIIATILCAVSNVYAATTNELVAYISKTFTIAGKQVKISNSDLVKVRRYLAENPVSSSKADEIIKKIDQGVALMNAEGVSDPTKLSKAKKEELLGLAQEAASLAGASISYDSKNKVVTIYKDGKVWDTVDVTGKYKQTGSNNMIYAAFAGVAIIAIATAFVYRKRKANA